MEPAANTQQHLGNCPAIASLEESDCSCGAGSRRGETEARRLHSIMEKARADWDACPILTPEGVDSYEHDVRRARLCRAFTDARQAFLKVTT